MSASEESKDESRLYNRSTLARSTIGNVNDPQDIEGTIELILQSQARGVTRMDRFDEELREQKDRVDSLLEISRNSIEYNKRMEEIVRSVAQILALQSVRLDRLEDQR